MTEETSTATRSEPSGSAIAPGEPLVLARSARWRLLVPMRHVERVHGAALPTVVPSAGAPSHPLVSVAGTMVPVVFCEALLGAEAVTLGASDVMILLGHERRRALLWISAAEDVVPFEPLATDRALPALAVAFSGRDHALVVLDVPKLLASIFAGPGEVGRLMEGRT